MCSLVVLINFLLRYFYAFFAWSHIEEHEVINFQVFLKPLSYQAFMGNYRILWSYENRHFSLDT